MRWLSVLLAILLVLGTGVHFLHQYQVARQTQAILQISRRAETQQDWDRAIEYLGYYMMLEPTDTENLSRYGMLLDQHPPTPYDQLRAVSIFEQVLRREPDRDELRRMVIRRGLALGRFADAREHILLLLDANSNDSELQLQLGQCEEAAGQHYDEAVAAYKRSVELRPDQIEAYRRCALVLQGRLRRSAEADQLMDQMVASNDQSAEAYLARAAYRRRFHPELTDEDVQVALRLSPNDANVLLAAAESAQAKSDLAEAREYLQRGQKIYPQDNRMYRNLADLEIRAGKFTEAIAELQRGLKAIPDQPDLLWRLADLLIQERQLSEAENVIVRLRQISMQPAVLDCLVARAQASRGAWPEAAKTLQRCVPDLHGLPELEKQAHLLLAQCYTEMGDNEACLASSRRAVQTDPLWPAARFALGKALTEAGRLDEAMDMYQPMLATTPEAREAVARLLVLRTARQPRALKHWDEVEKFLEETAQKLPQSTSLPVLQVEALTAQGQFDRARQKLEAAIKQNPKEPSLCAALARLYALQGVAAKGTAVLDDAQRRMGDTTELYLARARFWGLQRTAEARKQLDQLARDWEKYPLEDHPRVLNALAEIYYTLGETREPLRLWKRLAEMQPANLRVRLVLFDLAVEVGDGEALTSVLKDLRAIEGPNGPLWRYAGAAELFLRAVRGDKTGLKEARRLLSEVMVRRPNWSQPPLLVARIEELDGNLDRALENYQRATERGNRNPTVIRRLVQLLYERRRFAEADIALRKLSEAASGSGDVQRLAAEVARENRDYERAVELARKAVSAGSEDFRDHLWLGQFFSLLGRNDEAEASLRRAIALGESAPEVWVAFVQHLVRSGQTARVDVVLLLAKPKLPPEQATVILAQCQELAGRRAKAEELYRQAVTERPKDLLALRGMAAYWLRCGEVQRADPFLRRLLEPGVRASEADTAWARRGLAVALATTGEYNSFREALDMIEQNLRARGPNAEDLQAKAMILATRPDHRPEAIRLLADLVGRKELPSEQQFFLAQLYEEAGDWPTARANLLELLAREPENPLYLAYYAGHLIQRKEDLEAQPWLIRLEKLEPNTFRSVELRLRLLKAQNKDKDAEALARAYVGGKRPDVALVAAVLDDVGLSAAAEEVYRNHLIDSKRPDSQLRYIKYLSRQKRLAEALKQCERAWEICEPEMAAAVTVAVLREGRPSKAQFDQADEWIAAALKQAPGSAPLLICRSQLLEQQGLYPEAESVLREAVQRDSTNIFALNNLAWFQAHRQGQGTEALKLINAVLERVGPEPEFLDTRATVYLALGQPERAIQDLQDALKRRATPTGLFHLAEALSRAGRQLPATETFRKAVEGGLKEEDLHPLERATFRQLQAELEAAAAKPAGSS